MASSSEGSNENNETMFLKTPNWLESFGCDWTENGRLTIERISDTVPGCLRLYLASIQPEEWPTALTLIETEEDHCFSDTGISFSCNWSSDEDEEEESMIGAQVQSGKLSSYDGQDKDSVKIFAGPMAPLEMPRVHFLETITRALEQSHITIKGQKEFAEHVQEVKASISKMDFSHDKEGIPVIGSNPPSIEEKEHMWKGDSPSDKHISPEYPTDLKSQLTGLDHTTSVDNINTLQAPTSHVGHSSLDLRGLDLAIFSREDQTHEGAIHSAGICPLSFTVKQVQTALRQVRKSEQQVRKSEQQMSQLKLQTAKEDSEALILSLSKQVTMLTKEKEKAQKFLLEHKEKIQILENTNKTQETRNEELTAENTKLSNRYDKLQEEKDKAQKDLLEHKEKIQMLENTNKTQETRNEELTAENTKLSNRLRDSDKLQDEVRTLREKNEALQKLLLEKTQETALQQEIYTNILLVGCKKRGKSHTGNTILGQEAFRVTRKGGTKESSLCSSSSLDVDGVSRKVTVVDTPGVSQEMTESEFEELVRAVKMVPEGFDAICLVWDYNNSDRNEYKEVQVFQSLHRLFGDGLYEHLVILVTHAQQEDIPEFIESLTVNMKAIAEKANTVIAIDNKLKGESSRQLLLQHCPTNDTKYTSSDLSSECQIPPHVDLHMVLIGKSGVGKSSTGNSIIGKEVFKVATVAASVTTKCNFHIRAFKNADSKLSVLDTPGLFATHTVPNKEEIQKMIEELCKMLTVFYDGIHALILVISGMSRFTEEDNNALKIVQLIFGERFLDHTIVLITGKDGLKSSMEEYLESTSPTLRDILNKCQERCIFFDNVTKDATVRRKQLAKLVTVVQEAVKEKNGPYTGQGAQEPLFVEGAKMMEKIITNLSKEMPKDVQGPDNSGGGETKHPQHAKVLRSESQIDRARQHAASDEHEEYHLTTTAKSFFQTIKHIFLF